MKIYSKNGTEIIDVALNDTCTWRKELMSEEYVLLTFSTAVVLPIKKGCYVNTDFGNGRYELVSVDKPKYNTTTGGYEYEQKFHAVWEKWKQHILFYDRQNGNFEKSWSLTSSPAYFLSIVISNLEAAGLGTYTFAADEEISTEIKNITFDGVSIFDALNSIAEAWDIEWWVEDHVIRIGKCEFGTAIDFEIGDVVSDMQANVSGGDYATRIYVFGSTRNLPTNYRGEQNNAVVEGVVEKRLALPSGIDHIDAWENLALEDVIEAVVINDDIYPRRVGTISNVTTKQYTDTITNDDGSTTQEQWNAYRYKDSGLTFSKDYVLPGVELRIVFQTGTLAGLDFAVKFNPDAQVETSPAAQLFEIVRNEDYGIALPNDTMHPQVGDTYILYGYDTKFVADTLVGAAEQELLEFGQQKIVELAKNESVFSCPTNPVRCAGYSFENGELVHHVADEVDLDVGQSVLLLNDVYFGSGGRLSRVRSFEKKLDDIFNATYEVGDSAKYSKLNSLESEVKTISYKGATLLGGSNASSVALIKRNDNTPPTDYNAFSAARAKQEFLSKQTVDTAEEIIKFAKGLQSPDFIADASGFGIRKQNGNWYIEGDFFHIRKKLTAESVEIMHSSHIGGKLIATPGSMVVDSITIPDGVPYYRCYLKTEDSEGNEINNTFAVNDLAYCETFNLSQSSTGKAGNHFFWRKVIAVGTNYIDLSVSDCAAESDAPLVGDKITTLGNTTDVTRQNAIIMAGAGNGNPYIRIFSGINDYYLPEPDAQLSPNGSWIKVTDTNGQKVRIDTLVSSLENSLEQVREQNDKQIVIWFGDAIPTLSNEPASDWSTTELKEEHLKDIYYNKGYASTGGGRAYSFEKQTDNGTTTYSWEEITDHDVLMALEAANAAQDTADGKRRVFVSRPTTNDVYDVGDLWVNVTFPLQADGEYGDAQGVQHTYENPLYDNDILRCVIAKSAGTNFAIDHWQPVQKFTSTKIEQTANSIALSVTNLENNLEMAGVHIDGEDSEIRLVADKTKFVNPEGVQIASFTIDGLQSNKVQCLDENGNKRLEVDVAGVRMYYPLQSGQTTPQVMKEEIFLFDANGNVSGTETRYYNINGTIKWRLDSAGTLAAATLEEYWTTEAAYIVGDTSMQQLFQNVKTGHRMSNEWTNTTGRVTTGSVSRFTSVQGSHASYNGRVANGVIGDSVAPSSSTDWLTGWFMTRLTASYEGKEDDTKLGTYSRHFVYYNNGSPSVCTLTWGNNNSVIVSELTFEFNVDTHYITDVIYEDITPNPDL